MIFDDNMKRDIKDAIALLEKDRDTYMPSGAAAERTAILAALTELQKADEAETLQGYEALKKNENRVVMIHKASEILGWYVGTQKAEDMALFSRVLGSLSVIMHELSTTPRVDRWMKEAKQETHHDAWDTRNFSLMERSYKLDKALPADLVRALSEAGNQCNAIWAKAKPLNDWEGVKPHLEKLFSLTREKAQIYGEALGCSPYDALLSLYCESNAVATIDPLFEDLKKELPVLMQQIVERQKPRGKQKSFALAKGVAQLVIQDILRHMGFSLERGRIDGAPHPFCGGTKYDTRISHFYDETRTDVFFALIHETGHALYAQNTPDRWDGQPVGRDADLSIHESQSLIMEKQVAFGADGIAFLYETILRHDPDFAQQGTLADFQHSIQYVTPSFIRVDADEVTYPLHVILRYEIEKLLFSDQIAIADVPSVWNQKVKEYLGLDVPDYKQGCLQDTHWFFGGFGYFPTYTEGALYAAQLFAAAKRVHPDINAQLRAGNFKPLREWLTQNIHQYAMRYRPAELIERATGAPPSAQYFLDHIRARYL